MRSCSSPWERGFDAAIIAEERYYLEGRPHAPTLLEIARLAQVDYGRIDYTLIDGEVQVFEISTNPQTVTLGPSSPRAATGPAPP